jgi:hypothetical protein
MLAVYTGKMPFITIGNEVYLKNVPTHVKPTARQRVTRHQDMVLYDPKKDHYEQSDKYIYIVLPSHFDLFLASLNFIETCKKYYPCSPVKVRCDPNYARLLPKGVKFEDSANNNNAKNNYREYNLHLSSKQRVDYSLTYPSFSWEQVFLMMTKLYNGVSDQHLSPATSLNTIEDKTKVVIFGAGDNGAEMIEGLGERLKESIPNNIYFDKIEYNRDSLQSYLTAILQARYVIYCGDTDLCFMATYNNVPCFVPVGSKRTNRMYNLSHFKDIRYLSLINNTYTLDEMVSKIMACAGVTAEQTIELQAEPDIDNDDNEDIDNLYDIDELYNIDDSSGESLYEQD